VAEWRRLEAHRAAQRAGRGVLFRDYRLRIAAVTRDYGMERREGAPADSRAAHG
jgi:heme-degrading monooxygenase HmoA